MSIDSINNLSTRIAVNLKSRKLSLKSKQKGASGLEYAVLVAAIVVVLGAAVFAFGPEITALFDGVDLTGGAA
ncbi:hypothetical protein ACQUWM_14160 [Marinobacter sp. DUT-3]|uniref:hypothetical protein n=1 Tax=unclassified Marinobacter TaxID=83889 RepID=UPI00387B51FB